MKNELSERMTRRISVPGIFLKANLFGDGQRENNQDSSDNDGKFAVSVPEATGAVCVMSHCCYHCKKKNKKQELEACTCTSM